VLISDRVVVVAVDIDLGVVCFVDDYGQGLPLLYLWWCSNSCSLLPTNFRAMVLCSVLGCLFMVYAKDCEVIRSWRVIFVHSRRVLRKPYFVCVFVGPVTTCMLYLVKGGESVLCYCLMMLLVIFFHSLPWIASYCLMCIRISRWNPYMLFDSVISSSRMS
jgi:hypothetical protein